MPCPYTQMIDRAIAFNHRQHGNFGHGNEETAMPCPYTQIIIGRSHLIIDNMAISDTAMRRRQCRVPTPQSSSGDRI